MITHDEVVAWAKQLMETEQFIKGPRKDWNLDQWIEYLKGEEA
jgi:hypothetical protein